MTDSVRELRPQRGLYRLFTAERWPRRESSGGVRVPRRPPSASCVTGCTYRSNSGENRRLGRPERNDHGIATVKVLAERSHVVRRDRKRGHGQAQECVECGTPTYGAAWGSDQHRQIAKRPWKARESYASRRAARCSARLDRSGIDTRLNDERPPSEGPPRTESHCRWRPTPSPFSRLLSHGLTHVRPPLRLPFTLILNAMACAGASRHLGRPHTLSQTLNHQSTQSRSLNHQRDHGARTP